MMNTKRIVQAGLLFTLATLPRSSQATSELHKNVPVGVVTEFMLKLNKHCHFDLDIIELGPSSYNAVIDVFSYPDRTFLADGWPTKWEVISPAHLRVPAANDDRTVYVVVRSLSQDLAIGLLRVTRTSEMTEPPEVSSREYPVYAWNPPASPIPSGLAANTHVRTTEENVMTPGGSPGTNDTILMVLQGGRAWAFDDDSGLTRMSWLHLDQACVPSGARTCEILVAQRFNDKSWRTPGQAGYDVLPSDAPYLHTTLAWDEDIHNGISCGPSFGCRFGTDDDGDGLGDALEDYIGTDKAKADTDGDGVPDGVEVIGVSDTGGEETKVNLLRFPFYGADPIKPDLFIEVDWTPRCLDSEPGCDSTTKNANQLGPNAARLAALFSPDINVHIDNGLEPGDTTVYGNWGGAEMLGDEDKDIANDYSCKGFTPARKGYFTHGLAKNSAQNAGRCTALSNAAPSASTHEMGHYAGLDHWGDREGTAGKVNCKPHYFSLMNYNYQNLAFWTSPWMGPGALLPAFSKGLYKNLKLNPLALDETAGLGDSQPNLNALSFLEGVLHLKVDHNTGGVDWNANGKIETGKVQGMLSVPASPGGDCDPSPPIARMNEDFGQIANPSLNVEGDALYVNGILNISAPTLFVGMKPKLSGCASQGTGQCAIMPTTDAAWYTTDPRPGPFSPAVAGGIVVYADANGKLQYFQGPEDYERTGKFTWKSVTPVGGPSISGDPVAVQRPSGLVSVYAPSEGYLRRWDYHPALKIWVAKGITELLLPTDGGMPVSIDTSAGIGLTWGYQLAVNGEANQPTGQNLYAAILTTAGSGIPHILLARLEAEEATVRVANIDVPVLRSHWIPLGNSASHVPVEAHSGTVFPSRVGLAFRPDDPNAPEPKPGRFYVTWQLDVGLLTGKCYQNQPYFALSRGNYYSDSQDISPTGPNPSKALVFDRAGQIGNDWTSWASGFSLAYFQGNVRGVCQTLPELSKNASTPEECAGPPAGYDPLVDPQSGFFPNIDGIFNVEEFDYDDVSSMTSRLSWALKR
jgi:hypothetical protein